MFTHQSLTTLVEYLHRASMAQSHYAQDHPHAVQSMEAAYALLKELLEQRSPIILSCSKGRILHQGKVVDGAPNATQALCKEMEMRGIGGVAFYDGLDQDELQLLFFALQLHPQRLQEMGGTQSLLPEEANLKILNLEPAESEFTPVPLLPPMPPQELDLSDVDFNFPALSDEDETNLPLIESLDTSFGAPQPTSFSEPPIQTPIPPPAQTHIPPPAIDVVAPEPTEPLIPFPSAISFPSPSPPPSPADLAVDLRTLFSAIIQMTGVPPKPSVSSPWSSEQRETIHDSGLLMPDFSSVAGTGEQLGLSHMDPITLRDTLRTALSGLDPMFQGAILIGMSTFPALEHSLHRALDYLAPELLAQAVAEVHIKKKPSKFELALLVAGLLQCIKDRELALQAIRGRLQFEGWEIQDLDSLQDAILWECHGTDTKLQMSLMDRGVFELDAHQVMILNRQLLHAKRIDGVRDLLAQLEAGFASPQVTRRRQAAEIIADLAECLDESGLPQDLEVTLLSSLHAHLSSENDQQALLWSCQAMEALLGHWIRKRQFESIYKQMLALAEFALAKKDTPPWKAQAVRDLLTRLASPINMAALCDQLQQRDGKIPMNQLHSLLALMGRPAAEFLVSRLESEEDKTRRQHIVEGIRAIGRNAVPPLREALTSPHWYMVRNGVTLLGEIGHKAAFEDVVLALGHREPKVTRAAIWAVIALGDPEDAAKVLSDHLLKSEPVTQLDCLVALGELKVAQAVPAIAELLQSARGTSEDATRLRLRAVEVLGLIAAPEAIAPLQDLFKKKGFLGGRESTAIRLAAAKSLAAINTRESREAIALAMDQEPHEEVRAVLRQYLISS